jgi:hypothetical protein
MTLERFLISLFDWLAIAAVFLLFLHRTEPSDGGGRLAAAHKLQRFTTIQCTLDAEHSNSFPHAVPHMNGESKAPYVGGLGTLISLVSLIILFICDINYF